MALSKFLDPKNDVAFKKIFGTDKNKDILIGFLNDMIVFKKKEPIVDVTFLKSVQDPETAAKKTSIVDILCKDSKGNIYIVQMQIGKEKGFAKRAQYYASKAYISQANAGGKYHDLQEIVFLAICEFEVFPEKKAYKSDHVILDRDTYEHDLKDFSFTFLELPKFKKGINQLETEIERWAYFFNHAQDTREEEVQTVVGREHIIERAYEELNRFSWNDAELLIYEQSEKYERDQIAILDQKCDEGEKRGRLQGRLEEKRETARNMLREGIDVCLIMKITGLSREEIASLKQKKLVAALCNLRKYIPRSNKGTWHTPRNVNRPSFKMALWLS